MASTLAAFFVLALATAAAPSGPSRTVEKRDSLQSCAASMNGQLPNPTPLGYVFSGNVRRYYVAAEEVYWNYAPTGWDNWLGVGDGTLSHNPCSLTQS